MNKDLANAIVQGDNTPVVLVGADGEVEITSIELVQLINTFRAEEGNETVKEHKTIMRDIRSEIETLNRVGINQNNFVPVTYTDKKGEERPCFKMNKAGILQMLNKESAVVRFKTTQYIEKLEKQVKHKPLTPQEELRLHYQFLEQQNQEIQEVKADVTNLKDNMPLFTVDCKELQALVRKKGIESLGGYKSQAYNDKSLRSTVYSDIQNQLRREFGVSKYEAIKHSQLEMAKQIVNTYKMPVVLAEQVESINNQTSLLDV